MSRQNEEKLESNGVCSLCGGTFGKKAMTKHLTSCVKEKANAEMSSQKQKAKSGKLFHLVVEGRYQPEYWINIAAPAQAKLENLDGFLRNIWVECCGHCSSFTIDGVTYSGSGESMGDESMNIALNNVLVPRRKFYYEYDFGTTTDLALKVVSEYEGFIKGKDIQLMARNEPPAIMCDSCGKIATQVCADCVYNGEGWLCDECASKHECGEEMLLPVVNSPRVGMCGYSG
ncbi:MAG TPA: hypothetical protein ACFYD4_07225 [Candidatus Wunengus sp. YC61]|uniref:hypothetical protein n=1 Tax=Candidatus Wunengus sp. YC61 TaxID=3367698 RepID=UPI004029EF0C